MTSLLLICFLSAHKYFIRISFSAQWKLQQACRLDSWLQPRQRKFKCLPPCHDWFDTIQHVCDKTWCDRLNLCLLSWGDVRGLTQPVTSLKILLDKDALGPMRQASYGLLFLLISQLLAFRFVSTCTRHNTGLKGVKLGNLWLIWSVRFWYFLLLRSMWDWGNEISVRTECFSEDLGFS